MTECNEKGVEVTPERSREFGLGVLVGNILLWSFIGLIFWMSSWSVEDVCCTAPKVLALFLMAVGSVIYLFCRMSRGKND